MHADVETVRSADLVDVLELAAVGTAEAALVNAGTCVPPTVHMVSDLADAPYVGYVIARPFARGSDAAAATARIGALPAAIQARMLVATWEHADLSTALGLPGEPFPMAVVVAVATRDSHEVRWHPFDVRLGPLAASGFPTLIPSWRGPWREFEGELPEPIVDLLAQWRAGRDPRELRWVYGQLQSEGYTVHWMTKSPTARAAARRTVQ